MNTNMIGAVGGPGGGQPMMNTGTPVNAPSGNTLEANRLKLNTYIYDYFLKHEMYDLARMLVQKVEIEQGEPQKHSPERRDVNGVHDSMEQDTKDALHNKPDDLPTPRVPAASDGSFLLDWWCQFWDCYLAQRGRGSQPVKQYLTHVQVSTHNCLIE